MQGGHTHAPKTLEYCLGYLVSVGFTGPKALRVVFGEARPVAKVVVAPAAFGRFHLQAATHAEVVIGAAGRVADMDFVFVFVVCEVALNQGVHGGRAEK
jgi:hypothetical protein